MTKTFHKLDQYPEIKHIPYPERYKNFLLHNNPMHCFKFTFEFEGSAWLVYKSLLGILQSKQKN